MHPGSSRGVVRTSPRRAVGGAEPALAQAFVPPDRHLIGREVLEVGARLRDLLDALVELLRVLRTGGGGRGGIIGGSSVSRGGYGREARDLANERRRRGGGGSSGARARRPSRAPSASPSTRRASRYGAATAGGEDREARLPCRPAGGGDRAETHHRAGSDARFAVASRRARPVARPRSIADAGTPCACGRACFDGVRVVAREAMPATRGGRWTGAR